MVMSKTKSSQSAAAFEKFGPDRLRPWLLAGAAAFLLRKPAGAATAPAPVAGTEAADTPVAAYLPAGGKTKGQLLLEALKEELFAIESEKVAGKMSAEEYAEVKPALEIVLRRALARQ